MLVMKSQCWANALNRKVQHSVNTVVFAQLSLLKGLEDSSVQLVTHGQIDVQLSVFTLPYIAEGIQVNLGNDLQLQRIKHNPNKGNSASYIIHAV